MRWPILIQLLLASDAARIIVGDDHDDHKPVIEFDSGSIHTPAKKASSAESGVNINDLIDAEGGAGISDDNAGTGPKTTEHSTTKESAPELTTIPSSDDSTSECATDEGLESQSVSTIAWRQSTTENSASPSSTQSFVNYTASEFPTSFETVPCSTELPTDSCNGALGLNCVTGMHRESSPEVSRATFETNDPTTTIRPESYAASPESTAATSVASSESSTRSTSATPGETTGTTMKTHATLSKSTTKAPTNTTPGPDEIIVYLPAHRTDQAVDPNQRSQARRVAPSRAVVVLRCVPAYVVSRRRYDSYLERTAASAGLKKRTFENVRKTFRKFARDRASLRGGPSTVKEADRLQTYQTIKQHSLSECEPSERANVARFFQKLEEDHDNSIHAVRNMAQDTTSTLTPSTHEHVMDFLKSKRALTVDGIIVDRQKWPQVKRAALQNVIPSNETAAGEAFFKVLESRRPSQRRLICAPAVGKFATQTSKQRLYNTLVQFYRRTNLPSANFEAFMRLCEANADIYESIVEQDIDVVNRTIRLAHIYARIKLRTWSDSPNNERNALLQFFADAERFVITTYGSWLLDNAQNPVSLRWSIYRNALDRAEATTFRFNSTEIAKLSRLLLSENRCLERMKPSMTSKELQNGMVSCNCYWNQVVSTVSETFNYRADIPMLLEYLRRAVFFRNNYKNFLT